MPGMLKPIILSKKLQDELLAIINDSESPESEAERARIDVAPIKKIADSLGACISV